MENYAISARHMTGWDQARKEYLIQFQMPITLVTIWSLLKPQRVDDFRMTGIPELILKKTFSDENLQTETNIDRFATKFTVDPKLVNEFVQHLNDLKQRSQMRAAQRERKMSAA